MIKAKSAQLPQTLISKESLTLLPKTFQGQKWSYWITPYVFPILVWCAENEKTITYTQLDAEIVRRGWAHHVFVTNYGYPAGIIGDFLLNLSEEDGIQYPPINALVVNAGTASPGTGCDYYLKKHYSHALSTILTRDQRQSLAQDVFEEVYNYQGWQEVLARCGLAKISDGIPALMDQSVISPPTKSGWSTEPESEAHKNLKEWVSMNPQIFGQKNTFGPGETEYKFPSADCADVLFSNSSSGLAVEVKSIISNDADLERGIYQCIKYRALLRAELKAKADPPNGNAILVIGREATPKILQLGLLFSIQIVRVEGKNGSYSVVESLIN